MNIRSILTDWATEAGTAMYFTEYVWRKNEDRQIKVFTRRPGYLIGFKGNLINKYRALLKEKCNIEKVELIELKEEIVPINESFIKETALDVAMGYK